MKFVALLLIAAGACLAADAAAAVDDQIAPGELSKAVAQCESCHGPKGDSTRPDVPRLNGQKATYIESRLRGFRDVTRQDPHAINAMWRLSTQTGDEMATALAQYFAAQAPTEPLWRGGAMAAKGKALFEHGAPAQNIPACASCHVTHGEGGVTAPRLAGQHAAYLTDAMDVFRFALRESDSMHPALNNIDDDQIKALVAYLTTD